MAGRPGTAENVTAVTGHHRAAMLQRYDDRGRSRLNCRPSRPVIPPSSWGAGERSASRFETRLAGALSTRMRESCGRPCSEVANTCDLEDGRERPNGPRYANTSRKNENPRATPAAGLRPKCLAIDRLRRELPGVAWRRVGRLRERAGPCGGGRRLAWGGRDLLALALERRLQVAAFALDRGDGAAVEAVDVAAHFQLAGVVDEGGLIGQVHPDRRCLQREVALAAAVHPPDLLRRPMLARARNVEQNLGVFRRVLHAHAAVAVGAHRVTEQALVRRVVLEHREAG